MVGSANRVSMAPNNAGFAAPLQAGRGSLGVWGLASMLLLLTAACGLSTVTRKASKKVTQQRTFLPDGEDS